MKKLTSILLIAVILTSLLFLSSCDESTGWAAINKVNYTAYIQLNVYYSDVKITQDGVFYTLFCVVHVETSAVDNNYKFHGASVKLSPKVGLFEQASDVSLELDGNGVAHSSFTYYHARSSSPLLPDEWEFEAIVAGGEVIKYGN